MWIQDSGPVVTRAIADTIVTVETRDALGLAVDIAALSVAATLAALAVMMLFTLRDIRMQMAGTRVTLQTALAPLQERGRAIADNVEFITDALRSDVTRLNTAVQSLTDRLQQASDHMEERIEDFNALMEVVQGEAEEIFIDAAATAHGVKVGARTALSGSSDGTRRRAKNSSHPVPDTTPGVEGASGHVLQPYPGSDRHAGPEPHAGSEPHPGPEPHAGPEVEAVVDSPLTPPPDRARPLQPPGEPGESGR